MRLLNRAGVLHRHIHQPLLRAGADDPLSSQFQSDITRYSAYARLVCDPPRGVRVEVVPVTLQRLHNDGHFAAIDERRRLLAPVSERGGLAEAVRAAGIEVQADAVRQASRMYGHSLIDLLALANISVLTGHAGTRKFESAAKVLRERPEEVDLRIETEGPRTGMWSVVQPQWVTQVRRVR